MEFCWASWRTGTIARNLLRADHNIKLNCFSMPNQDYHEDSAKNAGSVDEDSLIGLTMGRKISNLVERISEVIYGLIMVLSFTCAASISGGKFETRKILIFAAIGCNIAWGLVDAIMFLLTNLAEKGHNRTILNFVRSTKSPEEAVSMIKYSLPSMVIRALGNQGIENLRQKLLYMKRDESYAHLTRKDFKNAMIIFLLSFLATLPVAIPFLFIKDSSVSIRVSNVVALVMMFICGWLLGLYGGYNKIKTGFGIMLIGVVLVAITIALGG
ncbi:MAG: hypothetical protein C5B59_11105 [Bacteroidetes bacterium]|nr:MAG: hypothetical protein C5B59_11105 [Bacteroidota bacterium]